MSVVVYLSAALALSSACFVTSALIKYFKLHEDSIKVCGITIQLQYVLSVIDLAGWTLLWYAISISFTLFNKWFMNVWQGGFHFPIFVTALHMTIKMTISQIWSCFTKQELPPLSKRSLFLLVVPIGFSTGLDIMLSNLSLEFISVTNYTLLKSTVLLWTFVWSLLLGASVFEWRTFLSVVTISLGLGLATLTSTKLEVLGTLFVLGASGMGGLRWALLQLLVLADPVSETTLGSIYRFSPASAASLIPLALYFDMPNIASSKFIDNHGLLLLTALLWIVIGGVFAFGLIYVEVKLVQLTSSVTLSVLGQLKDLIQITLGMLLFRDQLSYVNIVGVVVCSIGVLSYKSSTPAIHPPSQQTEDSPSHEIESSIPCTPPTERGSDDDSSDILQDHRSEFNKKASKLSLGMMGNSKQSYRQLDDHDEPD